jgi:hypothetical protein
VAWVIRLSDDAWNQYDALSPADKDQLRKVFFERWVTRGPSADGARLFNGVIFREADMPFGVRVTWLTPSESTPEILIVKIRPIDQ